MCDPLDDVGVCSLPSSQCKPPLLVVNMVDTPDRPALQQLPAPQPPRVLCGELATYLDGVAVAVTEDKEVVAQALHGINGLIGGHGQQLNHLGPQQQPVTQAKHEYYLLVATEIQCDTVGWVH